ncbi:MAG: DUF349 domain-containing protein, partial [Alistipes sp.]|nr:DUF349 domain-containing protein [Alistipes sp.]
MSTTIKSTETPELEVVSAAEDMLIEEIEQGNENPQTELSTITEDQEQFQQSVDKQLAGKSKSEIVDMLALIIEQELAGDIRLQVEQLKTAFYKLHRAQVDAQLKEAAEQGVTIEIAPDADEARLKELLKVYRDYRDKVAAENEKVKEENYAKKLEIIESLKALISSEETLNVTFNRFRELQARWKEIGQVPQS